MENRFTFTTIQDWMLDLGLDIYQTMAYAVIFGFSQDGESTFKGSLSYLGRKMMCSRSKVIRSLKEMTERGFLQKIEITRNGVKFCEYRAIVRDTGGVSQTPGGGVPQTPNNIEIENKDYKETNINIGKEGSLFDGKEPIPHEEPTPISDNLHQNKVANISADLPTREEKFKNACYQFVGEFGTEMVDRFIEYWTEPNKSHTKMRFELERTWDTHRRMLTWARNNFGKVKYTPQTEHKDISAQEALKRAGWI